MNYYKATIQYDGTGYFGFQWQKDIPSIQNDFNLALKKLIIGKVTTMGASRTDTGVHAVEQVVKITSENQIECETFLIHLNKILPAQIKCVAIVPCESAFKPVSDSISKEYRYYFTNTLKKECSDQKFIANNPYPLDMNLMINCAQKIVGRHDFRNFCSTGSNVKTTIRDISFCELTEIDPRSAFPLSELFHLPKDLGRCFQLKIEGSGFLKQMIRHLVSALWMVGSGKLSSDEFSLLLNGHQKDKRLWKVAPSRGLYLYRINYINHADSL